MKPQLMEWIMGGKNDIDRSQLIDDLIKENRDVTVAEYLEILKEIEQITPQAA